MLDVKFYWFVYQFPDLIPLNNERIVERIDWSLLVNLYGLVKKVGIGMNPINLEILFD